MRDTYVVNASPVYVLVDGSPLAVGWPLVDGQFGPLSVRQTDGVVRPCTQSERERFVRGLSYYYFVQQGRWAQAYGVAGTPLTVTECDRDDGGGSLV